MNRFLHLFGAALAIAKSELGKKVLLQNICLVTMISTEVMIEVFFMWPIIRGLKSIFNKKYFYELLDLLKNLIGLLIIQLIKSWDERSIVQTVNKLNGILILILINGVLHQYDLLFTLLVGYFFCQLIWVAANLLSRLLVLTCACPSFLCSHWEGSCWWDAYH